MAVKREPVQLQGGLRPCRATAGATLPVVFKFGTDTEPVYREFATLEDLTDFYTKAMQHIQNTLADGWKKKDVFDLSLYAVD